MSKGETYPQFRNRVEREFAKDRKRIGAIEDGREEDRAEMREINRDMAMLADICVRASLRGAVRLVRLRAHRRKKRDLRR